MTVRGSIFQAADFKPGFDLPIIAKLETPQAIKHLGAILEAADGVIGGKR